ncbi:hypothetical protein NYA22BAC_01778 [Parasphingorhabdus sp. NYA22]
MRICDLKCRNPTIEQNFATINSSCVSCITISLLFYWSSLNPIFDYFGKCFFWFQQNEENILRIGCGLADLKPKEHEN